MMAKITKADRDLMSAASRLAIARREMMETWERLLSGRRRSFDSIEVSRALSRVARCSGRFDDAYARWEKAARKRKAVRR